MPRDHGAGALNSDHFYAQGKRGCAKRPGRPGAEKDKKLCSSYKFREACGKWPKFVACVLWNFDFSKQLVWMGIPCKGISESSSYSA